MVERECESCGAGFPIREVDAARGRGKFCSRACQAKGQSRRIDCSCEQCGAEFSLNAAAVARGEGRYCSKRCYGDSKIVARPDRGSGSIPKSKRQRAKYWGVDYEPYSRQAIFERDNFVCGLCFGIIDSALEYPHDMSASIDHIVPMSLGGSNIPDNVQAAHLVCNRSKNNRESDQLQQHERVELLKLFSAFANA